MGFRQGDRVRIKNPSSEYTGCRGTIVIDSGTETSGTSNVTALGYFVAVDGENGRTRPFLVADLERIQVARVRNRPIDERSSTSEASGRTPHQGD